MATETRSSVGNRQVIDGLGLMLALSGDLHSQVKEAHWNVVGPNFIALHRLFDEQAAVLLAHVDLFAERMRALRAVPAGTVRQAAARSPLDDLPAEELDEEFAVRAILERFESYSRALGDAIQAADDADDLATQDLYLEAQRAADLHAYFLRSHLPGTSSGRAATGAAQTKRGGGARHRSA